MTAAEARWESHVGSSRRQVLRGAGALLCLPWLESLSWAEGPVGARAEFPLRLLFLSTPNGAQMDRWTPAEEGPLTALPPTLEPLAPHREQLLVLSGLTHDKARANGDGPGDHARSAAAFLTAAQPRKTAGSTSPWASPWTRCSPPRWAAARASARSPWARNPAARAASATRAMPAPIRRTFLGADRARRRPRSWTRARSSSACSRTARPAKATRPAPRASLDAGASWIVSPPTPAPWKRAWGPPTGAAWTST
ncbi:MAG: DUF1552 domain-containing protein [Planctomycetes bacterium]|nr:DUF1552 domain-containing protein [Planctomycetota bacterium]